MHKRILLYSIDSFAPYDHAAYGSSTNYMDNTGNNLFWFSIQKMMSDPHVSVDITSVCGLSLSSDMDAINERYDACVVPSANILGLPTQKAGGFDWYSTQLAKAKIPFHFIGVGAQSDRFYSFSFLKGIKKDASRFIKAILDTGGSMGLRGHFTEEAVKRLGFSDSNIVVTGCPSLFMNGSGLRIEKKALERGELKPVFTGKRFWSSPAYHHYFHDYPESIFVCQDRLYKLLYAHEHLSDNDLKYFQGRLFEELYKQNRIKLYSFYPAWDKDLRLGGYNFSVGDRFHGNIASLLAGIPCFIDANCARIKELCDFFHLPSGNLDNAETDLFELYRSMDPSAFNASFDATYLAFKKYMNERGLPCHEDPGYIQEKIASLDVRIPEPSTPLSVVEEMTAKAVLHRSGKRKKHSKLYRLLHFYWLRKLLTPGRFH